MSFKKGQSGNPAGRPKGSYNKVGAEQRDYLRELLLKNKRKFEKELEHMDEKEFVKTYIALMRYVLPMPAVAELKEVPQLEAFIAMTKEERQEVIDEIQESLKNEK